MSDENPIGRPFAETHRPGLILGLVDRWLAYRRSRYWTAEAQLEHLRVMMYGDHRWLASSTLATAMTERYLAALAPDWYSRQHEDTQAFRERVGLDPHMLRLDEIDAARRLAAEMREDRPADDPQ